jgi:serine/threonine protein kinase
MLGPGEVIEKYEVIAPIAAGGMGVVYRARHRLLGHEVALKMLAEHLALDDRVRQRFSQEAWVQSQLHHPNIVAVRDFIEEPRRLGFVMDLVEGPSLEQVISLEHPEGWPPAEVLALMRPVIAAVAYAHARGIVHRDLKPANVLLDRSQGDGPGTPKITDFGLVKVLASTQGVTRTGTVMGTVPYMAPEQFRGSPDIGPSADVFALGMMLRRMLTGELPVRPEDMMACTDLYAGRRSLTWLPALAQSLPVDLRDRIDRALQLDPQRRHPHAGALLEDLDGADATPSSQAPPAQPRPVAAAVPPTRASAEPLPPSPASPQPLEAAPEARRGPATSTWWVVGAAALVGLGVVVLPVVLDDDAPRSTQEIEDRMMEGLESSDIEDEPSPPERTAPTPAEPSPPARSEPRPPFQGKATAAQPSFDCTKAGTADEHLLCSHAELATLDRTMSDLYWKVYPAVKRRDAAKGIALKADQKAWLAARTACATRNDQVQDRIDCIRALYDERLTLLRSY